MVERINFFLFAYCLEIRLNFQLSELGKALNFQNSFATVLTYGHECWVMTKRVRSQAQASEMKFLQRIEEVTLFNEVRSFEIREPINIEPLLL